MAAYLVNFFQHQRTDPSTLVFDVHLAELVPIRGGGADFPDGVLVAYPVKEVVDPARRRLLKRVVGVDVDQLAVPSKVHWSIGGPMEHEGRASDVLFPQTFHPVHM